MGPCLAGNDDTSVVVVGIFVVPDPESRVGMLAQVLLDLTCIPICIPRISIEIEQATDDDPG